MATRHLIIFLALAISLTLVACAVNTTTPPKDKPQPSQSANKTDPQKIKEELTKKYVESNTEAKYLACLLLVQTHYKFDYKNIANNFYAVAHVKQDLLVDKHLMENLEFCEKKIVKSDVDYIIANRENEEKIRPKLSYYTMSSTSISTKLSNPALTQSQIQLKQFISENLKEEIPELQINQKLVTDRLAELIAGSPKNTNSNKKSQESDDRDTKVYKTYLWTGVTIGVVVVLSAAKVIFSTKSKKQRLETQLRSRKEKEEQKQKKKEEKVKKVQEAKKNNEEKKTSKTPEPVSTVAPTTTANKAAAKDNKAAGVKAANVPATTANTNTKAQKPVQPEKVKNDSDDDIDDEDIINALKNKKGLAPKKVAPAQPQKGVTKQPQVQQPKLEQQQVAQSQPQEQPKPQQQQQEGSWIIIDKHKKSDKKASQGKSKKKEAVGEQDEDETEPLQPGEKKTTQQVQPPVEEWTTVSKKVGFKN